MNRMLTNILTDDIKATRDTLVGLFDLEVEFDSDWFVSMVGNGGTVRIGAFQRNSDFVPSSYQLPAQGVIITIVVDDVESYFSRAKSQDLHIVEEPRDLPYGQRRMLVQDPSGLLIDISAPTASVNQ
ncbi:VOC family protein [Desmospora profundinema]|uniref:Enzyme related to lactoylglutathione lyase n=1 Tax=Desmospora profundinema TaxID=1571184 RepID=A0ABU1ILP7_9BACL|nr:VOC family protein [Desmospora profundinema]MDR6225709.1 putative enzyme related to lactoylglutathione lyase [Desmospora profundinema]